MSIDVSAFERGDVAAVAKYVQKLDSNVDLRDAQLSDRAYASLVAALGQSTTVTSVNLSRTRATGKQAAALLATLGDAKNTTLHTIYLCENMHGDADAVAIGAALKHVRGVTSLSLATNAIGEQGALALLAGVRRNTSLTQLELRDNKVPADLLAAIDAVTAQNGADQGAAIKRCEALLAQDKAEAAAIVHRHAGETPSEAVSEDVLPQRTSFSSCTIS